MTCANASCHCQSEVFITRQGADYCSEHCASATPAAPSPCGCGHVGCSDSEQQAAAESGRVLGVESGPF
jgi:hypothetical protein